MKTNWTREETIIAFYVYCKIPFHKSSKTHPDIIHYARLLGRTPSALNMKVGNIGRLDPSLQEQGITGLRHGAKMDEIVWKEFYNDPAALAFESEQLIAQYSRRPLEENDDLDLHVLPSGVDRLTLVKQRIHQSFFRTAVLSAYDTTCCISGLKSKALLDACHIVDWSLDEKNRVNPCNGLCLNPLFHRAYDKYYISITPDYIIVISEEMISSAQTKDLQIYLQTLNGHKMTLPDRFLPRRDFLERHYQNYVMRW